MLDQRLLIASIFISASTLAYAGDTLEQFARKCDQAIGVTVPDFNCDVGTLVPTTHLTPANAPYDKGTCDRPNQLHQVCDPGSRFQVLKRTSSAYVVAHCRKQGHPMDNGRYKDIAVIQHNTTNGATCFYQALDDNLKGDDVKAPSKGISAWSWKSPATTAAINCAGCHDNGPIIRSPYLSQITGPNRLPGAGDWSFNRDQPYAFVGPDFASWNSFKVEITGNRCNDCHRMGVNRLLPPHGTAVEFGVRATADMQKNKHPHSVDSPMWMLPGGQVSVDPMHQMAALAISDCASKWQQGSSSLPPNCNVTQFTTHFTDFPYPAGLTLTGSDFVVWRPSEKPSDGYWYIIRTDGSSFTQQWGAPGDVPVPGDYDRDGKIDLAVWRPWEGYWYVIRSSDGGTLSRQWGAQGDIPVPADYDNDGKIDLAVWRPWEGYWYIVNSSDGSLRAQQWGAKGDIPVPGDYNGDGTIDFAVWRPSNGNWHIKDGVNGTESAQQWGAQGDVPVPGHYHDGSDTRTDYAVWRPSNGNWHIKNSLDGTESVRQWGTQGDVPIPGKYDGDTRTDFAVWRPSDGVWYIISSQDGSVHTRQWGTKGDIPVPRPNS